MNTFSHTERTQGESHERAEGMAATSVEGTAPKPVSVNAEMSDRSATPVAGNHVPVTAGKTADNQPSPRAKAPSKYRVSTKSRPVGAATFFTHWKDNLDRLRFRIQTFKDYGSRLTRSAEVENVLINVAVKKRGPLTSEECMKLAQKLGIPQCYNKKENL
jgi:hypothetical protein